MSMKNFSDTIGNRTCDLPARSAVPEPTAPPCNLYSKYVILKIGNTGPVARCTRWKSDTGRFVKSGEKKLKLGGTR